LQVTPRAKELLCAYDWPGNVRELENAIERAATLCEGDMIRTNDLPPSLLTAVKTNNPEIETDEPATLAPVPDSALYSIHRSPEPDEASKTDSIPVESFSPLRTYLREQEQAYLNRALEQCGGDKEKAAILLGVSLATLYRKLSGEEKE
jgi:DNA-binding NtrC family response regulator